MKGANLFLMISAFLLMGVSAFADESEAMSMLPSMVREWTSVDSTFKVEAKAVKVAGKLITLQRTDNNQRINIRLDQLSEGDNEWIEENKDYIGKSEKDLLKMVSVTRIGKDLKGKTKGMVNGKWKKKDAKPTAKYFIVYYSASWCGPCRAGVPKSVEVYNSKISTMPGLELVMKNMDHSEEAAIKWAEKEEMPWPILYGQHIDATKEHNPSAVPTLVLLDGKGELIEKGSIDSLVEKARSLLKKGGK